MPTTPYEAEGLNKIYELLFCDKPELFAPDNKLASDYPWNILLKESATPEELRAITEDASLETRLHLVAYKQMRKAGHPPVKQALLGIVVEVGLGGGLDTLAAYKDGTARYMNHAGGIVIWDAATTASDAIIQPLFAAGEKVVKQIGPWDKERLPAPEKGMVRLSFLVTDGLYFGQAPFEAFEKDPLAGPVLRAATQLLIFLTKQK